MGKSNANLRQGTLDMLILKALSLGPMHGYGVGQRITQLSDEVLRVEEGSLYPALYRIEQQGWITSEWGISENNQRARFYQLTRDGRRQHVRSEEERRVQGRLRLSGAGPRTRSRRSRRRMRRGGHPADRRRELPDPSLWPVR